MRKYCYSFPVHSQDNNHLFHFNWDLEVSLSTTALVINIVEDEYEKTITIICPLNALDTPI